MSLSVGPVWAAVATTGGVDQTPNPNPLDGDWNVGTSLRVGDGSNGTLTINGGSKVSNAIGYIGRSRGISGAVTVDGTGSSWTNSSDLYVGNSGTGDLAISNGGAVSNNIGQIGYNSSSNGSVTVDGANSSWTNSSNLFVGNAGTGSLDISNGGVVSNTFGFIGWLKGGSGAVTVDGAGSTWTNSSDLYVGSNGTGSLAISNGGTVSAANVYIASGEDATGTLNIGAATGDSVAAGILNAAKVSFRDGAGSLVFKHTESSYNFAPDITGAGAIKLHNGTTRFTGNSGDLSDYTGAMTVDGGTLSVADGDTLILGGDYSQTANGLFKTGASSRSSFGKLAVTGTATFAANAKIDVDVNSVNTLANGQTLVKVISAGTLTASTFTVTDLSALFNFTADIVGNQVDIKINAESSSGVTDSVTANGFTSGLGAARLLDTFISGGISGTDMDNVVTALGNLSTDQQISDAVAETLPLLVGGSSQIATNTLRSTNRVIQARQSRASGLSSGDGFITDKNLWVKPVGSWSSQDERNGVSGYKAESYGLVGGIDSELNAHTRLGFALSYMNSDVDGRGSASGNKVDIDAYQAIVYGSRSFDTMPDIELNWQADIGINKNDGRRHISFMNRRAKAHYDSYTAHIGVGAGKRYELNDITTVIPSLRVDYAYIKDESYTEKGADALNLDVGSNHVDELIVMAQGHLSHQLSDKTSLTANAGLGYDFLSDTTSLTASYSGGGAAFTTEGIDPSPWLGRVGVGMNVSTSDTTEITARYDVEGREDFLNQTASVKFRWMF